MDGGGRRNAAPRRCWFCSSVPQPRNLLPEPLRKSLSDARSCAPSDRIVSQHPATQGNNKPYQMAGCKIRYSMTFSSSHGPGPSGGRMPVQTCCNLAKSKIRITVFPGPSLHLPTTEKAMCSMSSSWKKMPFRLLRITWMAGWRCPTPWRCCSPWG